MDRKQVLWLLQRAAVAAVLISLVSLAVVGLAHLLAPVELTAFIDTVPAKVTEFLFVNAIFVGLAVQVFFWLYLPTARRLILTVIYWAITVSTVTILGFGIAAIKLNFDFADGLSKADLKFVASSTNWATVFTFVASLFFVFLLVCKYATLSEDFLKHADDGLTPSQ